jgi:hypothetical protein
LSIIENIVIQDSPWIASDIPTLFEDEEVFFSTSFELSSLMKELGVYKSTSEARRNNRKGEIPLGYTQYKASKKVILYIWNPSE